MSIGMRISACSISCELNAAPATMAYSAMPISKTVKQMAAYFLTSIKPQTRAFSADVKATLSIGDEQLHSAEMTYKEAKKFLEDLEKQSEEDADDSAADDADDTSDDAAEDTAENE